MSRRTYTYYKFAARLIGATDVWQFSLTRHRLFHKEAILVPHKRHRGSEWYVYCDKTTNLREAHHKIFMAFNDFIDAQMKTISWEIAALNNMSKQFEEISEQLKGDGKQDNPQERK